MRPGHPPRECRCTPERARYYQQPQRTAFLFIGFTVTDFILLFFFSTQALFVHQWVAIPLNFLNSRKRFPAGMELARVT
jgi:hypothetical protein